MTVIATDDEGNEVVLKHSDGLVKYQIDEGFCASDKVLTVLRFAAASANRPLVDMDKIRECFLEAADVETGEPPSTIVVPDEVSGDPHRIEIDFESVDLEDVDVEPTFFEERLDGDPGGTR